MSVKQKLPPELTAQLARMIRRVRAILLTRGLLAVAAVFLVSALSIMAIDAAVVLIDPAVRWFFSLSGLSLSLATAWTMLVSPLARPLSVTRMARVLETRHPDMQERISSAIELAGRHGGAEAERASVELVALLTHDAKAELAGVRPRQEFTVRTVKPFLTAAACAAGVLCALFAVWPKQSWLLFLRALAPHREFDTLQASVLEVRPGDIMLLAQSPLRFEVRAPGRHGLRAEIHFQRSDGRKTVERMKRLSAQGAETAAFELEIPSVESGFEYRIRYGTGYTRPYTVVAMTAPRIVETRVAYVYPAYTGLPATQQVGEAQAITAVAGTRVRIETSFDRACAASLRINALTLPNAAAAATNAVWPQTLSTNRTGRWSVALRDAYGFTNRPVWEAYTAVPDRPPEVTLVTPEVSKLTLPPYDRLACAGMAADDFGFGEMSLVIDAPNQRQIVLPVKRAGQNPVLAQLEGAPDLQTLYDQNTRRFRLFLRVSDNLPPELGGPHVRESRAVAVTLDMGARILREQVREAARKELEEPLRKAAQQLNEAANRVAQEKWTFDKPELPGKTVEKLEQAREAAVKAEELMERAAKTTERTPFAAFAKEVLDVRDDKVEPAFKKLESIPLAEADKRKQVGEETERAFREAADKVNDLVNRVLQEENRKQEKQSQLSELAKREAALAAEAGTTKLGRPEMRQWVNRQNEAEQKLWQNRQELKDAAFNQALEGIRQAREAMQQADHALTPEAEQAFRRGESAANEAGKAASLAEKAAGQALEAAEKAGDFAGARAASDAVQKAAEKTAAAAEKAQKAAQAAGQAAEKRQANEAVADAAERKAIAEQAEQAARQAARAAGEAKQGAEQARQSAEDRQAGQKEQAAAAEKKAEAQAGAAKATARQANAEAVEAARQAGDRGMEKAAEAGRLASDSASFTQRAAELAKEAAEKAGAAEGMPEAQKQGALKEAKGLSEQSSQVADEAKAKAEQALLRAGEQLAQMAQEEKAAAAKQATPAAVMAQAQEAAREAREAVGQAREAMTAAQQAALEAKDAPPLNQALAERMAEAAELTEQAGRLAGQSGERTQQAEQKELGAKREREETRRAMQEAHDAAQLAQEAAALAWQTSQQASAERAQRKQDSASAARDASQQAGQAAQKSAQAAKLAKSLDNPEMKQVADQSAESAKLAGEAAALAQQSLQTAAQATGAADDQAGREARAGQAKARRALELAREAQRKAAGRAEAEAPQRAAAAEARQVAEAVSAVVEAQEKTEAEAWLKVRGRMGGSMSHAAEGDGAGAAGRAAQVPLNQDWIRFRGEMDSEAYEEMLKKTPAEYRELVKQYFEELSRQGQAMQR